MNELPTPLSTDHAVKLDRLAETAVRVGLNLRKGQEVVMTAPVEALDLARRVTEHAYRAGASLVTVILGDEQQALARYKYASADSFDVAPGWLYGGMAEAFKAGAARLAIYGEDPMLLADQDPDKVSRANRARSKAYSPALELIAGFDINWTILGAATPAWAQRVFPNDPPDRALTKLWDAIFSASRVNGPDFAENWAAHNARLAERTCKLNAQRFHALHFKGPGTDLTVGLADGHEWVGGASEAKNGIVCNANIPTEEVFTTPHKDRISGHVRATKPLSYNGALIEDIEVRFEGSRIVEARARTGQDVLRRVLETDEGAARLGEVALVPYSSPISKSGLLFYNTLFDENAASHIALGQAYSKCFVDGGKMSEDELRSRGANRSLIHIDWMIGSAEMDVDGLDVSGGRIAVMRKGEFVL